MSMNKIRDAAAGMGLGDLFLDWGAARTVEGHYRIKGCTGSCIERALAWSPYADRIWMETGKPILSQARQFSAEVKAAVPHQMLAHNQSPSFDWDSAGMTVQQMETFIWDHAELKYCWQFITPAVFHCDTLGIDVFARGMVRGVEPWYDAIRKGTDKDWEQRAGRLTLPDAVANALKSEGKDAAQWPKDSRKMSMNEMCDAAAGMGLGDLFFDWGAARSVEGHYRTKGCTEFCIERALAWSPYADVIWMETGKPILS